MNNILLDTCALLWLSEGGGKLSRSTIELIDTSKLVYVSSITAWEISLLSHREHISLPSEPEEWFSQMTESQDIQIIDLNPKISFISNKLPWHHKDPADRFIIATAMEHKLSVVTKDREYVKYGITVYS